MSHNLLKSAARDTVSSAFLLRSHHHPLNNVGIAILEGAVIISASYYELYFADRVRSHPSSMPIDRLTSPPKILDRMG